MNYFAPNSIARRVLAQQDRIWQSTQGNLWVDIGPDKGRGETEAKEIVDRARALAKSRKVSFPGRVNFIGDYSGHLTFTNKSNSVKALLAEAAKALGHTIGHKNREDLERAEKEGRTGQKQTSSRATQLAEEALAADECTRKSEGRDYDL